MPNGSSSNSSLGLSAKARDAHPLPHSVRHVRRKLVETVAKPNAAQVIIDDVAALRPACMRVDPVDTGRDVLPRRQPGHERGRLEHDRPVRSEEHTSELQSLMRISYAVFCLKKKNTPKYTNDTTDRKPPNAT